LPPEKRSRDHVVPAVLIERDQPRVKGFDYGGMLPTHEDCNNRFGPETYCSKALDLMSVLNDDECIVRVQHNKDPSIRMMAINSECLPTFTTRDLEFFRFIDVRDEEKETWSKPSFFTGKPRVNPERAARNVALAVLAKSAAALLIKRSLRTVPDKWRIVSAAYTGATDRLDFDQLLGSTKPFDVGVKVWLREIDTGDWFAIYRAKKVIVFFAFVFSGTAMVRHMRQTFSDTDVLTFEGDNLNELLTNDWAKV